MSDFVRFPATNLLGYGLDFTTIPFLFDMGAVLYDVKRTVRIIQYSPDEDTRRLIVGGVEYDIPRIISVTQFNLSEESFSTFRTGTEVISGFLTNPVLSARYLAVPANASLSHILARNFRRDDQWALYGFNADRYLASLQDYDHLLAEDALAARLENLSPIGNGGNEGVVRAWREFFASWGSHVVVSAKYGASYRARVWASNANESINRRFSDYVIAFFNGIFTGGQFDESVKQEPGYRTFLEIYQMIVTVQGGNMQLVAQLAANPQNYQRFIEWRNSISESMTTINLEAIELWTLMRRSSNRAIRDAALDVEDAYNYIVSRSEVRTTVVTFDIQSDWAEFNLLSPDAVIQPDPAHPLPDKTVVSNNRIRWGKEHEHEYEHKQLRFHVTNNGSPINFSTSHGSRGAPGTQGKAAIIIEGETYLNDQITDGVSNSVNFDQKPVTAANTTTKA